MKRFLLILLPLLNVMGAWADVTDLPKLTTDKSKPIYYVMHNTRSTSGSLIYYSENGGLKDNNPSVIEDKYKFYFMGSDYQHVKIYNAATGLVFAGPKSWTTEGVECSIEVTPHSSKAGLAIKFGLSNNQYLNEENQSDGYTQWHANDDGSIFVLENVDDARIPEKGQTYIIEAPLFVKTQCNMKGLSVSEAGAFVWKSVGPNNDADKWVVETNEQGQISLKNVSINKYLNGTTLSDTPVYGTTKYLTSGQFNIVINGTTIHANGNNAGKGESGNIVSLNGNLNTASAWTFVKAEEADFLKAYNVCMPLPITTDDNNKMYFGIKTGRTDSNHEWWYTYDSNDQKIDLKDLTNTDDQLWYFKGKVDGTQVQLQLFPKNGNGMAMSYQDTNDGAGKVVAKQITESGWTNTWLFVKTEGKAPYGLKTSDNRTYLSNHGGIGNKMGLYVKAPNADLGTAMYLYNKDVFADEIKEMIAETEPKLGTSLGYLSSTEAYTAAKEEVNNLQSTDNLATFRDAHKKLRDAISALPKYGAGKFYRIYNNNNTACLYANLGATGRAQFGAFDANKVSSIFYYDGDKLVSYNTGLHLNTGADNFLAYADQVGQSNKIDFVLTPEAGKLYVKFSAKDNNTACTRYLHNAQAGASNAGYNPGNDKNYQFRVEEVTWLPVAIRKDTKLTTLYSPVELDLSSDRVKAYTAKAGTTSVALTEQTVVPANTGVLLELQDGAETENHGGKDYTFLQVKNSTVSNVESDLKGSTADVHVTPEANQTCYVLSTPTGKKTAFYKAALNYGTNKEAFYNNGFKAYLTVATPAAAAVPFYGLDFNGDGTTGIENIQNGNANENVVVYDLSGRRVRNAQKGVYIINGKKVIK